MRTSTQTLTQFKAWARQNKNKAQAVVAMMAANDINPNDMTLWSDKWDAENALIDSAAGILGKDSSFFVFKPDLRRRTIDLLIEACFAKQ